jgi:hypothetical protein
MRKLNVLFLIVSLACGSVTMLACGDDDSGNNNNPTPPNPPGTPPPVNPPPPVLPPPPPPVEGGPTSFPAYVQDQIVNHTSSTTNPDPSTVWDPLADDATFVYPATFF